MNSSTTNSIAQDDAGLPPQPVSQRVAALDTVVEMAPAITPPSDAHRRLLETYGTILQERALRNPVPYHFVRELGKGRQGVVFLAIRQGARGCLTRHAIKLHDPGIYSSAEAYWSDMARLASQVSKLQPVNSDNLSTREAYDEEGGIGYLQMAVIDGIDLQYLLAGTHVAIARSQSTDEEWEHFLKLLFRVDEGRFRLQPGLAFYILRKVLMGLAVIHEAGYLHADIKPSNIMIDRNGGVKLVDFGRAVGIGEPITILIGSPLYMAPETHRLEPGYPQADIFGAGLVFFEMLRGQTMIDYANLADEQLLKFKLELPDRLETLLPPHLAGSKKLLRMLLRLMHPDYHRRFASAREAEEYQYRTRGINRELELPTDAEYDRELQYYLEKISDPETGHLNPRL